MVGCDARWLLDRRAGDGAAASAIAIAALLGLISSLLACSLADGRSNGGFWPIGDYRRRLLSTPLPSFGFAP